jgi:hypothetical protein
MGSRLQKRKKIFTTICSEMGDINETKTPLTEYFYIEYENMNFVYKNTTSIVLSMDELLRLSKTAAIELIKERVVLQKEKILLEQL